MNAEALINCSSTPALVGAVEASLKGKGSVHSFFSPSAAYRWVNCPGSEHRMMDDVELKEENSEHSFLGTILHKIADLFLNSYLAGHRPKDSIAYNAVGQSFESGGIKVTLESKGIESALAYVDYCIKIHEANSGSTMHVEHHTSVKGLPTGSVDCVIFGETYLHIIDYKSGFVDVGAEDNLQLISYGAGVYRSMILPKVERMLLTIHQGGYAETSDLLVKDLPAWEKKFARVHVSKFFKPGEWCYKNYCPYMTSCGQFVDWVCDGMELLVVDERNWVDLIPQAKAAAKFGEAVNTQLYKHLVNGGELEGYELGKRKKPLAWVEREDLKEVLQRRLQGVRITKPETLISPSQAKTAIKIGLKEGTLPPGVAVDDLTVDQGFTFTIKESKEGVAKKTANQLYFEELAAKFSKEKK